MITATITTLAGNTATRSMTVTSDGIAPAINISVDKAEGIAPFTANFSIAGVGATIVNVSVSGGAATMAHIGNVYSLTFPNPGTYTTSFSVTDSQGNAASKDFMIVVQDMSQMDMKLKALWSGMNTALIAGDKATALAYLSSTAQAKYVPVFDALMPDMQRIVSSCSVPQAGSISQEVGEYAINRVIDGINHVFFIYFLKGGDGVWRLDSM